MAGLGHAASTIEAQPIPDWNGFHPLAVAAGWAKSSPLLMLHSGRLSPARSRWSILASPERFLRIDAPGPGNDGPDPAAILDRLDNAIAATSLVPAGSFAATATAGLPFVGGWIGSLGYELGRAIEPAATQGLDDRRRPDGTTWPLVELAWCGAALVHDAIDGSWHAVGRPESLARLLASIGPGAPALDGGSHTKVDAWRLDRLEAIVDDAGFRGMVARTVELIRAGDIFQANIARFLHGTLEGDARAFGLEALRGAAPWYGGLLELPGDRSIVSLSPELFLEGDLRDGDVLTRPVKGTRPASDEAAVLMASEKDAAELTMIVDLMRNDLGRVCRTGSIEVVEPRHVESHPTVHHGVAGVRGVLRPGTTLGRLVAATFPPGSITGAPKIRAMQVIEALEPTPRGPYCGAVGFVSDHGRFAFNVAIRTLTVAPRASSKVVTYAVGCGIVADSDPEAERQESEDKAVVARRLVGRRLP